MKHREPNRFEVRRNTRTFQAYQKRMAAANQAGLVFFLVPAIFNPAIYAPLVRSRWPHAPVWAIAAIFLAWFVVTVGLMVFGWRRRQKYLREHPFIVEPEAEGPIARARGRGRPYW
jgi:hypothetical protein